jgi:perosamine synthetase
MATLAMNGGEKVRAQPWPAVGKRFGDEELQQLKEALDQNTLFYIYGQKTKQLCAKMAKVCGARHVVACSSGSAAVHGAVKACEIGPGDEVITSPLTDAGTILGVIYEGAIPVFADTDPTSYNITAASIEKHISKRTKAVIVVHLAGVPADIRPIVRLCKRHKIKVIEDCAQSWGATVDGKWVGTFGDVGTFSFNDYKHLSAGEGGLIVTDDDEAYATAWLGIDKCYDRLTGTRNVTFVAPNYRITELQSAVGIAQLGKLKPIISTRHRLGERLTKRLQSVRGVFPHKVARGGYATYWYYLIGLDTDYLGVDAKTFGKAMNAEGIAGSGSFYMRPVHTTYAYFRKKSAFFHSRYPFTLARKGIRYDAGTCPNAEAMPGRVFYFPLNEWLSNREIDDTVAAVQKVAGYFREQKKAGR